MNVPVSVRVSPLRRLAFVLSTFFGAGLSPVAPGTFGTLAAVPLAYFVGQLAAPGQIAVLVGLSIVASWAAAETGRALGVVDAGRIVIDEVAGYLLAMLLVPVTWPNLLAAFVLFRFFDILKPWPASFFDRKVKNGVGVVLDDLAAGVYARAGMAALGWAFPAAFGA